MDARGVEAELSRLLEDAAADGSLVYCTFEVGLQNGQVSSVKGTVDSDVPAYAMRGATTVDELRSEFHRRFDRFRARVEFGSIKLTFAANGLALTGVNWCRARTQKPASVAK